MDIARAFADAGLGRGVTINIQGTPEDPLFQASQIGELLEIAAIRSTVRDFDDDEKVVHTVHTLGGPQSTVLLTELGLYRLLGMSRKPFARPFQKWVAKVVKEIRLTGKYEMEQRLTVAAQAHQLALEAARHQLEDQAALVAARDAELAKIRTKIYEEIPQLDNVYINKEVAELASDAHKIGKAIDKKKRESQLNTGSAQGSKMIYARATGNAKIVEDIVKVVQRRYHIASIGGVEHYNNTVEHSVDVIDIAATVVDTLASSYEYMSRRDLLDKVLANVKALGEEDEEDDDDEEEEDGAAVPSRHVNDDTMIRSQSTVAGFVAARLQKTGSPRDHVTLKGAHTAYCAYCAGERKAPEKKGDFKDELLAETLLGGFSQPSGAKKNYWRGWVIKEADGDDEEEDAEEERDGLGD